MNSTNNDPGARLRRSVYMIMICVGTAAVLGRIAAVDSIDKTAIQKYRINKRLDEKKAALQQRGVAGTRLDEALAKEETRLRKAFRIRRPFLSANDRSRWCTVRALVEEEMRVPGAPYAIDRVIQEPTWDTIDMVKHDGHLYSSKPPLFPTLMAAEYWLIRRATGMTLGAHPYIVGRIMLVTINVVPLIVYFVLLSWLVERFGTTDWGRMFVMSAVVFGTFLTTFAVTINNHLPAAVCAVAALYAVVRIWFDGEQRMRYFALVGLFGALMAANELPAAALFAVLGIALLLKAPRQTLLAYLPASLVVAAGFFGTNWIAHNDLRPPYMHRSGGDNWYIYTYQCNGRELPSYWNDPQGVDRGEPSPAVYAAHALVGHHGIFSLTPVWLMSLAGVAMWLWPGGNRRLRELAILIIAVSAACLAFYLTRGTEFRNYGGMTCGLRWMFWLAPLWLLAMLPAADAMAPRRWTRGVALVLLATSVFSVAYPTWNPWTNPWIVDFLSYFG